MSVSVVRVCKCGVHFCYRGHKHFKKFFYWIEHLKGKFVDCYKTSSIMCVYKSFFFCLFVCYLVVFSLFLVSTLSSSQSFCVCIRILWCCWKHYQSVGYLAFIIWHLHFFILKLVWNYCSSAATTKTTTTKDFVSKATEKSENKQNERTDLYRTESDNVWRRF